MMINALASVFPLMTLDSTTTLGKKAMLGQKESGLRSEAVQHWGV